MAKPTKQPQTKEPGTVVDFAEIRRRREAAGWTLQELGVRAGVDPERARQWWSDLEQGRYQNPRISAIVAAARSLGCPVDALLLPVAKRD